MNNPREDNAPLDGRPEETNDKSEIYYDTVQDNDDPPEIFFDAVQEINTKRNQESEEIDNNDHEDTTLDNLKKEKKEVISHYFDSLKFPDDRFSESNVNNPKGGDSESVRVDKNSGGSFKTCRSMIFRHLGHFSSPKKLDQCKQQMKKFPDVHCRGSIADCSKGGDFDSVLFKDSTNDGGRLKACQNMQIWHIETSSKKHTRKLLKKFEAVWKQLARNEFMVHFDRPFNSRIPNCNLHRAEKTHSCTTRGAVDVLQKRFDGFEKMLLTQETPVLNECLTTHPFVCTMSSKCTKYMWQACMYRGQRCMQFKSTKTNDEDGHDLKKTPSNGHLVTSIEEFFCLSTGIAHFAVRRRLGYFHHFIVTGLENAEKNVVEYNGCFLNLISGPRPGPGEILKRNLSEEEIRKLITQGNLYFIQDLDYPKTLEEIEKAMERIMARVGESAYSVPYNNCEHFVTHSLTGKAASEQMRKATPGERMNIGILQSLVFDMKQNAPLFVGAFIASILVLRLRSIRLNTTGHKSKTNSLIVSGNAGLGLVLSSAQKISTLNELEEKGYVDKNTANCERFKRKCEVLGGSVGVAMASYHYSSTRFNSLVSYSAIPSCFQTVSYTACGLLCR